MIETDGTHVAMARGVATGEESHTGPSVTSLYTKKMDWRKGEGVRGKARAPILPQPHSLQAGSPQTSCFATQCRHPKPKTASRADKIPNIL